MLNHFIDRFASAKYVCTIMLLEIIKRFAYPTFLCVSCANYHCILPLSAESQVPNLIRLLVTRLFYETATALLVSLSMIICVDFSVRIDLARIQ